MGIRLDIGKYKTNFELLQKQLKAPDDEATKKAVSVMKELFDKAETLSDYVSDYKESFSKFGVKVNGLQSQCTDALKSAKSELLNEIEKKVHYYGLAFGLIAGGLVGVAYHNNNTSKTSIIQRRVAYIFALTGVGLIFLKETKESLTHSLKVFSGITIVCIIYQAIRWRLQGSKTDNPSEQPKKSS